MSDLSAPADTLNDGIDVLWLTAGLGCDGESIALTAATQPAIEDLRAGSLPGVPPLRIHNPVFAYEVGDAFVDRFHRAARGEIDPFILVVEGSIPDETNKPKATGRRSAPMPPRVSRS